MFQGVQAAVLEAIEARPGYQRTKDLPLLSAEVAFASAFLLYPAVVFGLRWLVAGSTYDTDAAWLRWCVGMPCGG
jgi:hypothetical protein